MDKKLIIALAGVILVLLVSCGQSRTENRYTKSIELGGEWFLNNQDENFIYYQYNPYEGVHPDKGHSLREMGALWSIANLAGFLEDERYHALAQKGFGYFEGSLVYLDIFDFYFVNITPEKIKLGYSAFLILALVEIEHPKKEHYLEKLANGILFLQQSDGSLNTFYFSDRATGVDYYPGEALLALISLYEYGLDERYLEAVEQAFPYYKAYFQDNPNTAFVPWQTRAYHKLYKATGQQEVADFIFEMNDYMLEQHAANNTCSDFDFHRGIVTAVYLEGVNKAYDLAREQGDKHRMECYANFIQEGCSFILDLQITEGFEKEAIGGFLGGSNLDSMRVDRNQHAVLALMDAYDLGLLE